MCPEGPVKFKFMQSTLATGSNCLYNDKLVDLLLLTLIKQTNNFLPFLKFFCLKYVLNMVNLRMTLSPLAPGNKPVINFIV